MHFFIFLAFVQLKHGLIVSNTIVLFEKRKVNILQSIEFLRVGNNSAFSCLLITRALPLNLLDQRRGLSFVVPNDRVRCFELVFLLSSPLGYISGRC